MKTRSISNIRFDNHVWSYMIVSGDWDLSCWHGWGYILMVEVGEMHAVEKQASLQMSRVGRHHDWLFQLVGSGVDNLLGWLTPRSTRQHGFFNLLVSLERKWGQIDLIYSGDSRAGEWRSKLLCRCLSGAWASWLDLVVLPKWAREVECVKIILEMRTL